MDKDDKAGGGQALPGRRALLRGGAQAAAASAALAPVAALAQGAASNLPPNVPEWMRVQGRPTMSPPYGLPSRHEANVVRRARERSPTDTAASSRTPIQDLQGIITPNGLVFERHHGGVPDIDPAQHRLMLHGLVERPLIFTMDDLRRFPSESRIHFLECSGNSSSEWRRSPIHSVQLAHGLISCCEWTGVRLRTLLEEAGVKPGAAWLLAEGADAAAMTRSIPLEKAMDDAMVVYAQNGEALRPEQGYPIRLALPGYEGNMWIKWLRRLELGERPFQTREETSKYTDLMPDGTARQFTFVMEAKSLITHPSSDRPLRGAGFHEVSGLAWSGHGRIARVDVSTDGGESWRPAALQEPVLPRCLTRFRFAFDWDGRPCELQSRAVDETGYVQPTRRQLIAARGTESLYHYNAIQGWKLSAAGEITNANA
ncbi:sulfite dehydrogenase [Falsiroseomonas sp. CW058]|uniref:sulfite dehydrogenase n=1 Tax=Falsiroseomonas sp. CW058 TaxID=3388664 RepID=UPI003D321734